MSFPEIWLTTRRWRSVTFWWGQCYKPLQNLGL